MTTMRKLAKVRPTDALNILRAYYYLTLAGWKLFVRRENLQKWLTKTPASSMSTASAPTVMDELRPSEAALWTNRAARLPIPIARCLQRSLALCLWLKNEGYEPTLRIGARKENGQFDAHAWVEYRGRVLNDNEYVRQMFPQLSAVESLK